MAGDPVTSFSMIYRPRFWGFEVYNMIRRLLLTCAVLVYDSLAATTLFVITVAIAIVILVIEQETKPYCSAFLSAYCHACCLKILLLSQYLLLLDEH